MAACAVGDATHSPQESFPESQPYLRTLLQQLLTDAKENQN